MTNTSKFFVGAVIVGAVAVGAVMVSRLRVESVPAPVAAAVPPTVVPKSAVPARAPRKTVTTPFAVSPELATLVKPLLQPGTDLKIASEGFATSVSFVATAHAARNLGIPFVVLKDRVVGRGLPLATAIHQLKPVADAKAEAARAIAEARSGITRSR